MIPKYLHRDAIAGLPDSALRDCLFLTGKRGYGKSYSQRNAMERALTLGRSMIYVAIQKQADKAARDIMDTLKRAGGALSWDEIAAEVNLHPRTKGLTNSRGWLNTLTVIEKKGDKYRLSNWVLGVRP